MTGILRVLEHHLWVYRRTWRGSVFVSFLFPILYLLAMGIGLGSLISRGPTRTLDGVPYISFIAPGLLAATTMQTAFSETTYPIMNRAYWLRTYDTMLATPLQIRDLLGGEIIWLIFRLTQVAAIFFVVMVVFRTVHSPLAPLSILAATLTGLAFGMPVMAYAAGQRRDTGFAVIGRFIVTPLFVLGGTFFPIDRLPVVAQDVAWLTPLYHGIALSRDLTVGGASAPASAIHLGVLAAYVAVGVVAARLTFRRKLSQ
jgi:lipooligosaccharide transport system permease protein